MDIGGYSIGGYSINGSWWLFYFWLLVVILLMVIVVILLMAIDCYFINDYWCFIILVTIGGYSIGG
jgi:hypothetical protein